MLLKLLADGVAAGTLEAGSRSDAEPELPPELAAELEGFATELPRPLLARGFTAWVQLFGVITFELFGRLNGVIETSRREFFEHQMRVMGRHIGL